MAPMKDQLQKAINLVKKTGDKLIVFDSSKPDNVFVVLTLTDYENLVLGTNEVRGLTEDELLDKINRDIAIWKSEQKADENMSDDLPLPEELPAYREFRETAEKDFVGANGIRPKEKKSGKSWSIPSRRKMNAEEIIEEDRQYLEDLAF